MGSFDYSSLNKVLEEYPDFQKIQVMVETGTFLGRGARTASKYVREVHTIEISNEIYKDISERLQSEGYHNITVYHGNSVDILPKLIPQIKELCLFFLDAHWSGDQTVDWDGSLWKGYGRDTGHAGVNTLTPSSKEQVPLLEEFLIITEQFPHKCVLYIDDMDKFDAQGKGLKNKAFQGEDWSNLTVNKLLEALGERLYAQHNLRNQWVLLLNEKPRQTQIQDLATLSKELPNSGFRELPNSGFNAEIVCQDSLVCIAGEPLNLKVKVKNISNSPWNNNALTLRSKYAICLGNHWLEENGKLLKWNDGRCFLEKGADIGQQVEVTITVNPPQQPGKYQLELDIVQEAISWFAKHGSKTKKVRVLVMLMEEISSQKTSPEVRYLLSAIQKLGKWYHKIELGHGITTPGNRNQSLTYALLSQYLPKNLESKTVLDLGANACGLSVEFAKRGANVLAVEYSNIYCQQAKFVVEHFGLTKKIQIVDGDLFDIMELGVFDYVCYLALAYHIRYPQLAFDMLGHMTRERIFFSTQIVPGESLILQNRAESERPSGSPMGTLYGYKPTELMTLEMCSAAGFRDVELISRQPHPGESEGNYLGHQIYCTAKAPVKVVSLPSLRLPPKFKNVL